MNTRTNNKRLVGTAVLALVGFTLTAAEIKDRFFYMGSSLSHRPRVEKVMDVVRRAGKAGFNGMVLQGDVQDAWRDAPVAKNLVDLKAVCDESGIELIPAIWSCGYGTMLGADPNLAEGLPCFDVPYVVSADGTKAVFANPESAGLDNGSFETVKNSADGKFSVPGWTVDAPGELGFIDRNVKFDGEQSVMFDLDASGKNSDPQARMCRRIKFKPNRRYLVTARVKTAGIDSSYGIQISIWRVPKKPGDPNDCLTMNAPHLKKGDNDWTLMQAEIPSLEFDELVLYIGSWNARKGRVWFDDVRLVEQGFPSMLRRAGCPLTVRDAESGCVYEAGRDYVDVPPLRAGQEKLPRENGSLVLSILKGGRIRPNARLLVSGYRSAVMKSGGQTCTCMSEEKLYDLFDKSAEAIERLVHPKKWFLPQDEVRMGGTCKACRDRNTDMAHIFGECVRRQREIIRRHSPNGVVYMWGDQIDPNMNAHDNIFMCRGTYEGVDAFIPKDIVVMYWGGARTFDKSMAFLREKGFVTARSYNFGGKAPGGVPPEGVLRDFKAVMDDPVCRGYMYTTWSDDYAQEKFDVFTKLFKMADERFSR